MNEIQSNFIKYAENYACNNSVHIWLGGSFLLGGYTAYSDIDISIWGKEDVVNFL